MTYLEYKKKSQAEFDALPIFFAFSNEQFKEEMNKRGLSENDTDKIYKLGSTGGFYLRSDSAIIENYFRKQDDIVGLMDDNEFAQSAFYYEMGNHEYHINWQADWDVCSCFGDAEYAPEKDYKDYLREMGYGENTICNYAIAKKKFLLDADTKGWY